MSGPNQKARRSPTSKQCAGLGRKRLPIACAFPLLTACASGEWVKSGGEIADEPVLIQCSQQAGARARSEQMSSASAPMPGSAQPDQQQVFFNQCMKELGYDYVPIMPGAGR